MYIEIGINVAVCSDDGHFSRTVDEAECTRIQVRSVKNLVAVLKRTLRGLDEASAQQYIDAVRSGAITLVLVVEEHERVTRLYYRPRESDTVDAGQEDCG